MIIQPHFPPRMRENANSYFSLLYLSFPTLFLLMFSHDENAASPQRVNFKHLCLRNGCIGYRFVIYFGGGDRLAKLGFQPRFVVTIIRRLTGLLVLDRYGPCPWGVGWLIGCLTAHQHKKVNLCQLRGRETGSVVQS